MSLPLLKKLAGHTAIYGLSTIVARLMNYLLTPFLTYTLSKEVYGVITDLYALAGFMMVLFTYGMETAFFRYSKDVDPPERVYTTGMISIMSTTILVVLCLSIGITPFTQLFGYPDHLKWTVLTVIWIVGFDALCALPFAWLRFKEKAIKFSTLKIINICVYVGLVVFFLKFLPDLAASSSFWNTIYFPDLGIGYVFVANFVASLLTLLLLLTEILTIQWSFDKQLWKTMLLFAWPLIIVGLSGTINELLDRFAMKFLLDGDFDANMGQVGIYGAVYKLSILMTLFTQAFKMGAEPFFFQRANHADAQQIYADSMKYFFIVGCLVFMGVMAFMDILQYFIQGDYRQGLKVVPILLLANLFLGVYYNLAIWYKVSNNTKIGAGISLTGAVITVALNILLVPVFSYVGSAWTTLVCYATMVAISYLLSKKYYPIPYDLKRLALYLSIAISVVLLEIFIISTWTAIIAYPVRICLLVGFCLLAFQIERKHLNTK